MIVLLRPPRDIVANSLGPKMLSRAIAIVNFLRLWLSVPGTMATASLTGRSFGGVLNGGGGGFSTFVGMTGSDLNDSDSAFGLKLLSPGSDSE